MSESPASADPSALRLQRDDLTGEATQALVASHLADMNETSPEDSCHALGVAELQGEDVVFWSAWRGDRLAGVGGTKDIGEGRGELKSMRVADEFRGTGVGRAVLRQLIADARDRGLTSLWLETGTAAPFVAAQRLYASEGFVECEPFGTYRTDPHSMFMTRAL